jgi:predicted HTH transcriptional regulator
MKDRGFIVWGIENKTKKKLGTSVRLADLKRGGENFANWLSHCVEPRLMIELTDLKEGDLHFSILAIEPTYDRPVRFKDAGYLRIGENVKELKEYPEHERALWAATNRRRFEGAIALPHQSAEQVFEVLNIDAYYKLLHQEQPKNRQEIVRRLLSVEFVREDMEGGYDITNLGAILFARKIRDFPTIATKIVRLIRYLGTDKRGASGEYELNTGYAVSFSELITFITDRAPQQEQYVSGVRRTSTIFPETAVREVVANALIHQDLSLSGAGPTIEMYANRIEVINPGNSLIEVDRIIDERRSRNEKLAAGMRGLGLCEERGGGLDKAIIEIEERNLPPPNFISSENSMRVVLFGPKKFSDLARDEKQRACFHHCVIQWIKSDPMSNASLRARFQIPDSDYQAVSDIISQSVKQGRIMPADPNQGRRNARYVPYWAG